jgi:hypothetical protein
MDALELLKADHDKVRELFARFKDAKESDDAAQMDALRQEIFHELHVHTSIEKSSIQRPRPSVARSRRP